MNPFLFFCHSIFCQMGDRTKNYRTKKSLLHRASLPANSLSLSLRFAGLVKEDYACNKILPSRDVRAGAR